MDGWIDRSIFACSRVYVYVFVYIGKVYKYYIYCFTLIVLQSNTSFYPMRVVQKWENTQNKHMKQQQKKPKRQCVLEKRRTVKEELQTKV